MSTANSTPEILTRLGYDGSDLKKGFSQARQDYANYKAQAVLIETELKRERVRLATEFSTENRRQIQQRIDDLRKELAVATGTISGKRGAERVAAQQHAAEIRQEFQDSKQILASYEAQKLKVAQLSQAQVEAVNKARQAQAAAGLFRETGRATGEIPGLSDMLSTLAPGLAGIQSRLAGIMGGLVKLGGGVKGASEDAAEGVSVLSSSLTPVILGFSAATAAGVAFTKFTISSALEVGKFAQELDRMSQKTGISQENLLLFGQIGKTVGVDIEQITRSMRTFSAALVGGGAGEGFDQAGNNAAKILKLLGVSAREPNEALIQVAKAFASMPDGAEKARIAVALFGREGLNLIPFLNRGEEGIKAFRDEMAAFPSDFSGAKEGYDKLEEATVKWEAAVLNLKTSLAGVLDIIADIISAFARLIQNISGTTQKREASDMLKAFGVQGQLTKTGQDRVAKLLARDTVSPGIRSELARKGIGEIEEGRRSLIARTGVASVSDLQSAIELVRIENERLVTAGKTTGLLIEQNKQSASLTENQKKAAELASNVKDDEGKKLKEITDLEAAERAVAEAKEKQLNVVSQIAVKQAELSALQSGEVLARATNDNEELTRILNQQAGVIKELNRLEKEHLEIIKQIPKPRFAGGSAPPIMLGVGETSIPTFPLDTSKLDSLDILSGKKSPAIPSQTAAFFRGLHDFSDVVGKFDSGLNRNLVQMFALVDGFQVVIKQMKDLSSSGSGIGTIGGGIKSIFTGHGTDASGAQTNIGIGERISGGLGLIGTAISAVSFIGKIFGGLFGGAKRQTQKMAADISTQIKSSVEGISASLIGQNLDSQISKTQAGIDQLGQQWASAVSSLQGRKGGGEQIGKLSEEFKNQIQSLQGSLRQLYEQREQVVKAFLGDLGKLAAPEGVRDAVGSLQSIAFTLNSIRDAGVGAGEQMAYLDMALGDLTATLGRGLRTAEQGAIDLLMQEIDLQKQREQVISDAAEAEDAVRRKAGLSRVLTPGQQAAKDIAAIRKQRDEQLAAIDEQKAHLDAQLGAQAELFGLTNDRNALLAEQLKLESEVTAEVIARIAEQKAFYDQISTGIIPSLPEVLIPGGSSNFNWNINGATIQVVLPSDSAFTPEQAAAIVRDGLTKIGQQQQAGF